MQNARPFWLLALCAALSGCGDAQTPRPGTSADVANSTANGKSGGQPSAAETKMSLEVRDWKQTQDLVASHKGKVVVLDIWSTYCLPCIREFPNLVALQKKYGGKIACISVNTNYNGSKDEPPESHREQVLAFLTKQKAEFQNVIINVPDLEFYDQIKLAGPPAVYVYDKRGNLQKRFDNESGEEFTYQKDVIPLIEKLLRHD